MLNPADTAQAVSNSMQHKAHTPLISVIFLAVMAGAAIAMGDIFWAHSTVGMAEKQSIGMSNFIGGITFSCGLMMVVFYGGHLFTSSVLTGVPAADGKLPLGKTAGYWAVVWFFNFVGGALIAYMYYYSGLPLKYDGYILQHFIPSAVAKINAEGSIAKGHYLAAAGGDVNALASSLHGVSAAQLDTITWGNFIVKNLVPVTLGNICGGLFFVGLVGFMVNKFDMKKSD